MTSLEYFQKQVPVDYYMNGTVRKIDETQKMQTFNANISLSESYPLSLHEQVLPIVDLMALNNSHFKKLKEFITLQLPSGFPVKIGKFLFNLWNTSFFYLELFFIKKKECTFFKILNGLTMSSIDFE